MGTLNVTDEFNLQLSGGLLMQTTSHCYYVVDTYIQAILCFEGFVYYSVTVKSMLICEYRIMIEVLLFKLTKVI